MHKSVSPQKESDSKRVAVIPGDGIGKEVIAEAVKVLRAAARARQLELVEMDWGTDRYLRDGTTLPEGGVEMLRREFNAILLGAMGDPRVPSNKPAMDILLGLRFQLDLFANVRPVALFDRRLTPLRDRGEEDVRLVIIRENTEGHYVGMGGIFKKGMPEEIATQEDINTRKGVERIIRYAFEYARARRLRRLCMSDKSNALRFGHDLWQRVFAEVRAEYKDIESRHLFIDTLAMELVRDPRQFDVIVTCNLFGDIISDLGAALVGGLGLTPSANINPQSTSMFEPVHGSAPDIAGKNLASPLAAVLTAAMMCEHFAWHAEATKMNDAVRAAIREGKTTRDLGGSLGTREVGDWLAGFVAR
jgi:3-isopropylmalate dehydrogenase